jgi:hypothetical protein
VLELLTYEKFKMVWLLEHPIKFALKNEQFYEKMDFDSGFIPGFGGRRILNSLSL